ncbi:uncharacterized protein EV422DRAFT_197483 [Fimicolochytrium jonesii]|uniref:uncharacterized protein n=1 Tax=Fimicolochytrium jonesii TaxID=1396493 RepID=UPI0022FDE75F|nr:uncharacterized protein EV422DRAFT_197483 [Fimicolochytrium jonesii]KAI8817911.1 hypothetical protein EV422DRAFT_197483 [Fimicolochytrium jonesii]
MPKIVSSSTVSASNDLAQDAEKNLHVYYCKFCGEYVLIIDKRIHKLPRRPTDNASVITKQRTFKLNLKRGTTRIIKRSTGYEKQCRWECPRCDLPVAYDQEADTVYLFDGSVEASGTGERARIGAEGKVLDKRPSALQATADQLIKESKERYRLYG